MEGREDNREVPAAGSRAGYEKVRNQQLERKDEGLKTEERNMYSDINE